MLYSHLERFPFIGKDKGKSFVSERTWDKVNFALRRSSLSTHGGC